MRGWLRRLAHGRPARRAMAVVLRRWLRTVTYERLDESDPVAPGRGAVYVLWHRYALTSLGCDESRRVRVLVSAGRDGEWATRVLRDLGVDVVRGSSSRRGDQAVREMLTLARSRSATRFAVAPDGPKGPPEEVKTGAVYLAARLGVPVIPVGLAVRRGWRLGTWDRLVIPLPFTRVTIFFGAGIEVPTRARVELEGYRDRIAAALTDANRRAGAALGA